MFGLGPGYRVLIVDDQATQRQMHVTTSKAWATA
jgi:hypothetical protein